MTTHSRNPSLKARANPGHASVYKDVTKRILALMDRDGLAPWTKPWLDAGGSPFSYNGSTGRFYEGINILLCSAVAQDRGYTHNEWWTDKQVAAKGGHLLARQKSHLVYLIKPMVLDPEGEIVKGKPLKKKPIQDGDLDEGERLAFMIVGHAVYNRDQCTGLPPARFSAPPRADLSPIKRAQSLIDGNRHLPSIHHGGKQAYFSPRLDYIQMPNRGQFSRIEFYHSTLFHEATHSTGHQSRLVRKGITEMGKFGDANYSKEELVAEMGAAFLCSLTGIDNQQTEMNSAAYLKGWRDKLAGDPRLMIQAAAQASKAVDFIVDGAKSWAKAMPERTVSLKTPKANPKLPELVGLGRLRAMGVISENGSRYQIFTRDARWLAWRSDVLDLVVVTTKRTTRVAVSATQVQAHENFHGKAPRDGVLAQMPDRGECSRYLGLLEWVTYNSQPIASSKGSDDYRHFFGDVGERGHGSEVGPRPYYPKSCMPELWCSPNGDSLEIRRRRGNKYTVTDWILA